MNENDFRYCLDVIINEVEVEDQFNKAMLKLYDSNKDEFIDTMFALSAYLRSVGTVMMAIEQAGDRWQEELDRCLSIITEVKNITK